MEKQKSIMKIKKISKKNYLNFYKYFSKIEDFKVSNDILFYELKEIKYWIENPKNNLLYGIFDGDKCCGFCFCKIISNHWALIDNFYISKEYRCKKLGKKLQNHVENILKKRKISYVSRVTKQDNLTMQKFLNKTNYKKQGIYIWFDKFL